MQPVEISDLFWDASDANLSSAFTLTADERANGVTERDLFGMLDAQVRVGDKVGLALNMVKIFVMVLKDEGPLTSRHWKEVAEQHLKRRHAKYWVTVLEIRKTEDDDDEEESYLVRPDEPAVCMGYCEDRFWVKRKTVFKVQAGDSNH